MGGGTCFLSSCLEAFPKALCLSKQEVDILQCLVFGENDSEVAAFGVRCRTVRTHLERIRRKLKVRTRVQMIVRVFELRIAIGSVMLIPHLGVG